MSDIFDISYYNIDQFGIRGSATLKGQFRHRQVQIKNDTAKYLRANSRTITADSYNLGGVKINVPGIPNLYVEDYDLRRRMMQAPKVLTDLWKSDIGGLARKVFKPHVIRRIPVRGVGAKDFTRKGNPSRKSASKRRLGGRIANTFNAWGTLEATYIQLGGKRAPFTAVLEFGSIPHSTYYRSPTLKHSRGHPILRWVGGGGQGGFEGYQMLHQGVLDGMWEWKYTYIKYNNWFLEWLDGRSGGIHASVLNTFNSGSRLFKNRATNMYASGVIGG